MSFRLLFTSFLCVFVLASTSAYGRKKANVVGLIREWLM